MGSTGIAVRTAADTWAQRTITASDGITVTNGDGVSGNPTLAGAIPQPAGRLTLVTLTPVLTSDQTAKTAIYYTPYVGDLVPIYDGSKWTLKTFAELTLTLDATGHASGSVYDVFVWNDSGTIRVGSGPAWSTSTARGTGAGTTELQRRNGIWTNATSITLRNGVTTYAGVAANTATYVGTFYATANGQTGMNFSPAAAAGGTNNILGLYNAYNRVRTSAISRDSTASWTYGTGTWRAMNNSNSNRISFVDGLQGSSVAGDLLAMAGGVVATGANGMSINSTSASPQNATQQTTGGVNAYNSGVVHSRWDPQLGFNYVQAQEWASGTQTWLGAQSSGRQTQSLVVELEM